MGKLGDGEARLSFRCHVSQSRSGSFHCRFHLTVGCPLRLAILNCWFWWPGLAKWPASGLDVLRTGPAVLQCCKCSGFCALTLP